jgi:hypothetical protein
MTVDFGIVDNEYGPGVDIKLGGDEIAKEDIKNAIKEFDKLYHDNMAVIMSLRLEIEKLMRRYSK